MPITVAACGGTLIGIIALWVASRSAPQRVRIVNPAFLFVFYYFIFRFLSDLRLSIQSESMVMSIYPALGMLATSVGALIGYWVFLYHNEPRKTHIRRDQKRRRGQKADGSVLRGGLRGLTSPQRSIAWILFTAGLLAAVVYYGILGRVPLFYGMVDLIGSTEGPGMHEVRRATTHQHRHGEVSYFGQGYFRALYGTVLPVSALILSLDRRIRTGSYGIMGTGILSIAIAIQFLDGRIWLGMQSVAYIVLGGVCVEALTARTWGWQSALKIWKRFAVFFVAGLVIVIVFRYMQTVGGRHVEGELFDAVINRLFFVPTARLYEIFPSYEGFRYGTTWLHDLRGFLPGSVEAFSYEVHYLVHGGTWGFSMSPTFYGSMYANFGVVGILIVGGGIGFIVQMVGLSVIQRKTAVGLGIYAFYCGLIMLTATSDIARFVYVHVMLMCFLGAFYIGSKLWKELIQGDRGRRAARGQRRRSQSFRE